MQADFVFVDIFELYQGWVVHRPEDVDLPLQEH